MSHSFEDSLAFSPSQQALVEMLLQEEGLGEVSSQTIPRRQADKPLLLSFAQQRLWFLDQLEPNSSIYNVPAGLRLSGPLNVACLERSLNEIVRRHEALRTTFPAVEGQPVQVISPSLISP